MKTLFRHRWLAFIVLNAAALYVLGLYQGAAAPTQAAGPPFANPIEQRMEIIQQLKDLNASLKEQNALLRSGKLRVVIEAAR